MALAMAPATSTIEIVITVRICLSVRGKSSCRRPNTNVRTIAQTAHAPPRIQNGLMLTPAKATGREKDYRRPHERARAAAAGPRRARRDAGAAAGSDAG